MTRRAFAPTFLGMVALLVGWLAIHDQDHAEGTVKPAASSSASASASSETPPPVEPPPTPTGTPAAGGAAPTADGSVGGGAPGDLDLPTLDDAPKSVKFGVVLVQFQGAQGAPEDARSKADALKIANDLAKVAKDDFEEAVKQGDKGSTKNAGKMFRGILEPNVEYALFSLEEGAVSDVVDTPRGFWIVKRND